MVRWVAVVIPEFNAVGHCRQSGVRSTLWQLSRGQASTDGRMVKVQQSDCRG